MDQVANVGFWFASVTLCLALLIAAYVSIWREGRGAIVPLIIFGRGAAALRPPGHRAPHVPGAATCSCSSERTRAG